MQLASTCTFFIALNAQNRVQLSIYQAKEYAMAIKFEKIKPGMTLWDVRKNTGYGRNKWNNFPVYIQSVNSEDRTVEASWNRNKLETMREGRVCRYRANPGSGNK